MGGAGEDVDIEEEEMNVERIVAVHNFDTDVLKEMLLRVREVAGGKNKGLNSTPMCK